MKIAVTPEFVADQRSWVTERDDAVVPVINDVRMHLGNAFDTSVDTVDRSAYRTAVSEVFADGTVGVNVATVVGLLRELDVADDYPGFIIDELLGRELAAMIAGNQPFRLLAEATFHVADVLYDDTGATAGIDDLHAGLAAGFQTRLPGWQWTEQESPFSIDLEEQ